MAILGSTDLGNGKLTLDIDHDPTVTSTDAPAGSIFIDANNNQWRKLDDGDTLNVEPMITGIQRTVTQAGHGFSDPISSVTIVRHNGTSWVKAQADSSANSESIWVVIKVIDTDTFIVQKMGELAITGWGLSANTVYFLDPDTAGTITTTKPSTTGQIVRAIIHANSTTQGEIITFVGYKITDFITSEIQNVIYVAKNGDDVNGNGNITNPFLTIKAALASITDNDSTHRYIILVCPGVYTEDNPLVCKQYVDIAAIGTGNETKIQASNTASDLFTATIVSELANFILTGTTSASLVSMSVGNGSYICRNVTFLDAQTGVTMNNTTGAVVLYNCVGFTTPFVGSITTLFSATAGAIVAYNAYVIGDATITTLGKADGATASVNSVGFSSTSSNVTNGLYASNSGTINASSNRIQNVTYGCRIGANGGSMTIDSSWFDSSIYDIYIESSSGEFHGSSITYRRDRMNVASGAKIAIYGHDHGPGVTRHCDCSLRILQDLNVGRDGSGHEFRTGEGGPYVYHTSIKTYNGSTYATIADGSNISFPNLSVNTAIYFGDTDSIKFYGIGYTMGATPINLGTGSIVWEYYDGGTSSWLAFNTLNTLAEYSNSQNKNSFTGTSGKKYAIRFDHNIKIGVKESSSSATGWVPTSVNSVTGYWIRVRIATAITTSPVFSLPRMKGNYSGFRKNGTRAFQGEARGLNTILVEQGANAGSTANASLSVSTNIDFSFRENSFVDGYVDRMYFKILITPSMDTSCGLNIIFGFCTPVAPVGASQTAKMHFASSTLAENATFNGTGTELLQDFDFVVPNGNPAYKSQRITMAKRIDISGHVPGSIVYGSLYRLAGEAGDTLAGNVNLSNCIFEYREWQDGLQYE